MDEFRRKLITYLKDSDHPVEELAVALQLPTTILQRKLLGSAKFTTAEFSSIVNILSNWKVINSLSEVDELYRLYKDNYQQNNITSNDGLINVRSSKYQTLGSLLRFFRKRGNITQEVLAKELEVSRQTIVAWENDIARPSPENLKSLIETFMRFKVFSNGKEHEQVLDIWKSRSNVEQNGAFSIFDEEWFAKLLQEYVDEEPKINYTFESKEADINKNFEEKPIKTSTTNPVVLGPVELLTHTFPLSVEENPQNCRVALTLIDSAVFLILKNYFGMPKIWTGNDLSRRDYYKISDSFADLLDLIEKYTENKVENEFIFKIENYHKICNALYYPENGLIVKTSDVENYRDLAKELFKKLFGFELKLTEAEETYYIGLFITNWVELENTLLKIRKNPKLARDTEPQRGYLLSIPVLIRRLKDMKLIDTEISNKLDYILQIRNTVTHSAMNPKNKVSINTQTIKEIKQMNRFFEKLLNDLRES